jgi:Fe-S-cluster containining protein
MKVDKDKPWTWVKYRKGLCNTCVASCCMMPVEVHLEDLLGLGLITQDEAETGGKKVFKRLKKEGVVISYREGTGLFMLTQRTNGDCYFLHPKTRQCTVYECRPGVCRKFPTEQGPKLGNCPYVSR